MEHTSQNLEELFRNTYHNHTQAPSARVLRRLRYRLWLSDFFSFSPNKLNIYYATILTGSIVTVFLLPEKTNQDTETKNSQIVQIEEIPILQTNKIEKLPENTNNIAESNIVIKQKETANLLIASFNSSVLEGCVPLSVTFYNQSKNAKAVLWDFGDGNVSDILNPGHTYTKAGKFTVKLNISGSEGQKASYSKEVHVLERPIAAMKIEMDNTGSNNREVIFKNISKGGSEYSWDFGDSSGSLEENTKHIYSNYGIYYVTLVATSTNGCKDTAGLNNDFIDKDYELSFPFNFRPNDAGLVNKGYYQSTGTETSIFFPKNYGAQKYELKIFSPNGSEVFSTKDIKQGWNGFVNGRLVPAGIYNYEAKGIYPNGKSFEITGKVKVIIDEYFQN